MVSRNHQINSIVESYLEKHPEKRRAAAELESMDKEDNLGPDPRRVGKRDRDDDSDSYSDDDDDDDGGGGGGLPFPFAAGGLFGGGHAMMQAHQAVMAAMQPCPGCRAPTHDSQLRALRDMQPSVLPPETFGGNRVEQRILNDLLAQQGRSLAQLLQSCVQRLGAGELTPPTKRIAALGPVDPGEKICLSCQNNALASLIA